MIQPLLSSVSCRLAQSMSWDPPRESSAGVSRGEERLIMHLYPSEWIHIRRAFAARSGFETLAGQRSGSVQPVELVSLQRSSAPTAC